MTTISKSFAELKATGEGIGRSLHLVEVSFLPGEPARLLSLPAELASAGWHLHALAPPAREFTAALALATEAPALRCWACSPCAWLGRQH